MASISTDRSGNRTIQFIAKDKKRRSVRLGKVSIKLAESVRLKIESLNSSQIAGVPIDADCAKWLATVADDLHGKIAACGLCPPRARATLGEFLGRLVDARACGKPNTHSTWGYFRDALVSFFGPEVDLKSITHDDAKAWLADHLEKNARATAARRFKFARQAWAVAISEGLADVNPWTGVKLPSQANDDRQAFVEQETVRKVLAVCRKTDWRTVIALARFGGLRAPSEALALRPEDIQWDAGKILVHAPKTEHHEGHETRLIPIFSELRPYLEEAIAALPEGAPYVIQNRKLANESILWLMLRRQIKRAGLEPWPRLFTNLRSSRETELMERFPSHVVHAWIGHSKEIADRHYLQVMEGHFERAANSGATDTGAAKSGAYNGQAVTPALQKQAQSAAFTNVQEESEVLSFPGDAPAALENAVADKKAMRFILGTTATEAIPFPNKDLGNVPGTGAAQSGAPQSGEVRDDQEFSQLIRMWDVLTSAERQALLSLLQRRAA